MPFKTTFQKTQDVIDIYITSLENYTDDTFLMKKDDNTWSVGQMYEHIFISAQFFMYQTNNCLSEKKGQMGGDKTDIGENIYQYDGFPPIKIKIPEAYQTAEQLVPKTRTEYKTFFVNLLLQMEKMLEILEKNNGEYKVKHAVCGFLGALEWYKMVWYHSEHHFIQKKELEMFIGLVNN